MPHQESEYYNYPHQNTDIKTLGDFVTTQSSIGFGLSIEDLLNYDDVKGVTNLSKLKSRYSSAQLLKYNPLFNQAQNAAANKKSIAAPTVTNTSTSQGSSSTKVIIEQPQPLTQDGVATPTALRAANDYKNETTIKPSIHTQIDLLPFYESVPLTANQKKYIDQIQYPELRDLFTLFCKRVSKDLRYDVFIVRSWTAAPDAVKITNLKQLLDKKTPPSPPPDPHSAGIAIDINLIDQAGGPQITSLNDPRYVWEYAKIYPPTVFANSYKIWEGTGVVKIAEEIGLVWGGKFDLFDPGHFDARNYLPGWQLLPQSKPATVIDPNSTNPTEESVTDILTYSDLPLPIGVTLAIPLNAVDRVMGDVFNTSQVVDGGSYPAFLAKQLYNLLNDVNYRSTISAKDRQIGSVRDIFPHLSVWIWSRGNSSTNFKQSPGVSETESWSHKIYNVTPYVASLTTNNSNNGGNFTIDLSPLSSKYNATSVDNHTALGWATEEDKHISAEGDNFIYQTFLNQQEGKRSRMLFEKLFQANDIVFIRFEKLEIERGIEKLYGLETISIDQLPNKIFDMIGLIDNPNISTSMPNVDVTISGRDLTKLLIEDGVYFYPSMFIEGGIFANSAGLTGAANQRLVRYDGYGGATRNLFTLTNRNIKVSLQYIINALAVVGICPDNLFEAYSRALINPALPRNTENETDKRSVFYPLEDEEARAKNDLQKDIEAKKKQALSDIVTIRKKNGIVLGSELSTYNQIESFLQNLIDTNGITETFDHKIKSWIYYENGSLVIDIVPFAMFEDILFLNYRTWTDNNRNTLSSVQLQLTGSLEDIYSSLDPTDVVSHGLDLLSNLRRLNNYNYSAPAGVVVKNLPFVSIKDILSQILDEIVRYSNSETETTQTLFNSIQISELQQQYDTIYGSNDIGLMIIPKQISDLTVDELSVFNQVYSIIKSQANLVDLSSKKYSVPMKGIWQIVKFVIDDSVSERLLCDSSIGNEMGSIINAIRKICQDPFCEFFTDTYGDQFYFIARKKPFDYNSVISYLENTAAVESNTFTPNPKPLLPSLALDIEDVDVINDSFTTCQEAYSWYHIKLPSSFTGGDSQIAFAYMKALYFDEYARMFGAKSLDVTTNYIPYAAIQDKNTESNNAYFLQQLIKDQQYLIESHAYLPFTRQGTITINGDRRFKKNNFVRYKPTGEIFYIDSVTNNISINGQTIDRTTTLHVSRGMVEKFIKGISIEVVGSNDPIHLSYFDICNLPIPQGTFSSQSLDIEKFSKTVLNQWKVNPMVFNFFLSKAQFGTDQEISDFIKARGYEIKK